MKIEKSVGRHAPFRIPIARMHLNYPSFSNLYYLFLYCIKAACYVFSISLILFFLNCKSNNSLSVSDEKQQLDKTTIMAPIFFHGPVRAFFGMSSTPIYLTEQESLAVINETAKMYGLNFKNGKNIILPTQVSKWPELPKKRGGKLKLENTMQFHMDGYFSKKNISFECISAEDDFNCLYPFDSSYEKDLLYDALILHDALSNSNGTGIYAIFYSPITDFNKSDFFEFYNNIKTGYISLGLDPPSEEELFKKYSKKIVYDQKKILRSELRNQVRDFIQWLKAQGII